MPPTAVDVYGEPGPEVLLLLHGAVVNRAMWRDIAPRVTGRWCVLAPDLPGHGELRDSAFRLSRAVERVAMVLREHDVRRVVLVGESLGGYVAMAAARPCEARLAGLVLSGSSLNPTGPVAFALRSYAHVVGAATRLIEEKRLLRWTEVALRRSYPAAAHESILSLGPAVSGRSEALLELAGQDFVAEVEGLDVPVLLMNGGRDLVNRAGERAFLNGLDRSERSRLRGVGHGVALADPRGFGDELLRFLEHRVEGFEP